MKCPSEATILFVASVAAFVTFRILIRRKRHQRTDTTKPTSTPTILFDLNYNDDMNDTEARSLARQLTLSYASNRRADKPFKLAFGTPSPSPTSSTTSSALFKQLNKQDFNNWKDTQMIFSETPWDAYDTQQHNVIYMTADSENLLTSIDDNGVYIIGGLVDHTDKIGVSNVRAKSLKLKTARFPLTQAVLMSSRNAENHLSDRVDVSTIACVQLLLSRRKFSSWAEAIYNTPAFHSAPLRKFIRWLDPYAYLNNENGRPYRLGKEFNLTPANFSPPTRDDIARIVREGEENES